MTLPVVVTGVSSGIGAAIAEVLARQGRSVVGVDRTEPRADLSGFVHADLSTPQGVIAAVKGVQQHAPDGVGNLVNVAGVPGTAPWSTVISVNVLGLRDLTLGLAKSMPSGSSVVHLASSVAADWLQRRKEIEQVCLTRDWSTALSLVEADPELVGNSYRFSKECVRFLAEQQAAALLGSGVRVTSVSPGPVDTPILEDFKTDHGREKVESAVSAVGRFGTPDDVAQVVHFLVDPVSRWINGTDIRVDGGLAAYRAQAVQAQDAAGVS